MKSKFFSFLRVIAIILFMANLVLGVVAFCVYAPFLTPWLINLLFGTAIPYSFITWLVAVLTNLFIVYFSQEKY